MNDRREILRTELVGRLVEIVEREIDPVDVRDDDRLGVDLGLASLDAVMLTLELEDRYEIEVSDEELLALRTVADLLDLVGTKIDEATAGAAQPESTG